MRAQKPRGLGTKGKPMSEEAATTTTAPVGEEAFKEILEQAREEHRDDSQPEDESEEFSEDYDSQETSEIEEEEGEDEDYLDDSDEDSDEEETEEDEDDSDAEAEGDQDEEGEEDAESEDEQPTLSPEVREMQSQLQAALGMLDQQKKFNGELVDQLKNYQASLQGRRQQQQPAPKRTLETQQLEDAFRLSLFGTAEDKEAYEALPPTVKKKAKDAVQRYSQEETLNILYPEKRYTDQIRYFVMQDVQQYVQQAMGGLTQDYNARKAENVFSKYESNFTSDADRKRLLEVMDTIPGNDSKDWATQEKVLELAVQQVLKERKEEDLISRERELEMRERQLKQSKTKRSGAKGKRGRRRSRSSVNKMKSGDDILAYARKLEKEIRNGG